MPADHGRTDRRRDVVVSRCDVGDQRAQRVERRFVAEFVFFLDLFLDLIERNVARPFDHGLNVVLPGFFGQFTKSL